MTSSGIEPATCQLVARCLNQLPHRVTPNLERGKRLFLLQNIQTGCRTHPAPSSTGTGGSFPGVRLVAHLHLAPRLRMSGAEPLMHLYAFRACRGTPLTFYIVSDRRHFCKVGHKICTANTSVTSKVSLLDALVKLRNATVSFAMSVCLSVCLSVRPSAWNK
jgi:hypothetical protein